MRALRFPFCSDVPRAVLNGVIVADSDETVMVEGNHYFPPTSIAREHFSESNKTTICGWKGTARYYDVTVGTVTAPDAAWYYPNPEEAASEIAGYVAFWKGRDVIVEP